MAIPASHIVNVLPRVLPGGSNNLELNGLLFSLSPLISANTLVMSFPSAAGVGEYFGENSPEYSAALVYFTSFDNKQAAPRALMVARRVASDIPAYLRGSRVACTLAQLKTIKDGAFTISVDNTALALDGLDFSTVASYSQAAQVLEEALSAHATGITVSYSSLNGTFTIESPSKGGASEVGFAECASSGADLAGLLGLSEAAGALVSKGMDAMSIDEQMAAVLAKTQNWVSFSTVWECEPTEACEWAAWANKHYGWLYVAYTTHPATISADSSSDLASQIKDKGFDHSAVVFGTLEYAAFIMGVVASIAWQRANGAITTAFKRQSGLAPWVANEVEAAILESKRCNYFGNFATRNAEFVFLYPGCLSASSYGFIDPYINSIWLNNRIQVALMDGLSLTGRAPYNTRGYTMIKAWMMDPVNDAKLNGVIEPGVMLSEAQKSEVMNEAGLDIADELWTQGYYLQVLDPGAQVRAERGSPITSIWYTYGGAVQKLTVAATAVL